MTVNRDLNVAYHQQDTSYYCGAACAQMVLDSIGTGLLDQDDLYDDNHNYSVADPGVNWATGPDGLEWTMNDRRPAGHNSFVNFALSSEDSISRKICWTIHHYQVAPIALVFGWAHWIVVRGYGASADPTSSGDTSYTINDFDVNNPWPPVPSLYDPSLAPPPPHSNVDGCGTGGNRGIANENIPYSEWQSTYMTGVPSGHWAGKFIAVCDPEPPPTNIGRPRLHLRRFQGLELITPDAAAELATTSLQEVGLSNRAGGWEATLANTQPASPLLVQRLDRPDSYYYIVPMKRGSEEAASAVRIDARFGDYLGAVMVPSGSPGGSLATNCLPLTLSQDVAFENLASQRIELGPRFGRLRIRRNVVVPYSTLVWKPCLESLSPYYPFYMYIVGSQRVYVRVDGQTFTELHDDIHGI